MEITNRTNRKISRNNQSQSFLEKIREVIIEIINRTNRILSRK